LAVAQKFRQVRIVMNDLDPDIHSFWRVVACGSNDEFLELIHRIEEQRPTVDQFRKLRAGKATTVVDRAFRAFFFNRTASRGISTSGPLGGYDQAGKYKIDSRWNSAQLVDNIKRARQLLFGRTTVLNEDFEQVIAMAHGRYFIYVDPPYYKAGNQLYTSKWTDRDHQRLKDSLMGRDNWLLSYDAHPLIKEIYPVVRLPINASYSMSPRKTDELLLARSMSFCGRVYMVSQPANRTKPPLFPLFIPSLDSLFNPDLRQQSDFLSLAVIECWDGCDLGDLRDTAELFHKSGL
jgi:DNA adenine methylase